MKKIKFILAATLALAAISCSELEAPIANPETNPETNPEDGLVILTLSTGEATKTHIEGDQIHWDSGDQIKVFTNENYFFTNAFDFKMDGNPEGSFARFTGNISKGSTRVWAVYPAAKATSCDLNGKNLNVSFSSASTQAATENSFDSAANVSIAGVAIEKSSGLDAGTYEPTASVNFKNVCSYLKFSIPASVTNIESVAISADQNIVGDMTFDYSGDELVHGGITANGSNSITMTGTFTGGSDYYFVLAPVAIKELSIYVNTSDNKQYAATQTFSTPLPLNAGEYKSIGKLNVNNMPSFGVDFDIQDDGGFLNGTDVVFTFPSDNVSNLHLTVSNGTTTVRRIDSDGAVKLDDSNRYISSCLKETETSWPYLPKGTYTVSGTYETEGGTASVNNITFEINTDPNFTVGSFDAYTSYTKYTSGKNTAVAEANACDGASIYVTASNVGIHENILKNTNYKDMIQVQFVAPASNYGVANLTNGLTATLTNQQYGEYTSPSYVFDGKAVTFPNVVCHVTGIPYALSKTGNDSINKWSGAGTADVVSWTGNDGMVVGGIVGSHTIQKSFHIPSDITVAVSTTGNVNSRLTGTVTVGGTQVVSKKGTSYIKPTSFEGSKVLQFKSSNSVAQVNLSSTIATGITMKVQTLSITYYIE